MSAKHFQRFPPGIKTGKRDVKTSHFDSKQARRPRFDDEDEDPRRSIRQQVNSYFVGKEDETST